MNLGENIYKYRTARNMSQSDLAQALDVSRQSVSKWENNSAVPELDKLIKMAKLFDITLDALANEPVSAQPSIPPSAEPVQYPQDLPPAPVETPPVMTKRTLVGSVLLCCCVISLVLFIIFEVNWGILFVSLPLGIISALCLITSDRFRRAVFILLGAVLLVTLLVIVFIFAVNLSNFMVDQSAVTSISQEVAVVG